MRIPHDEVYLCEVGTSRGGNINDFRLDKFDFIAVLT